MAPAVDEQSMKALLSLVSDWDDTLHFYLNGTKVTLENADPEVTLLEYLRGIGLTGTKLGCSEGGCGACTVVVSQYNPTTKKIYHASVNACLAPLASIDGKHVITVEGIGSSKRPHPAQERIAKWHGSQCGFCTPGIVMSLYALLRNNPDPTQHDVEEAFDGNLCRCTGYRPILDAAQSFSTGGVPKVGGGGGGGCAKRGTGGCCMDKKEGGEGGGCAGGFKEIDDGKPIKRFTPPGFIELQPDTELIFPPALKKYQFKALAYGNKRKRWLRPVTVKQLLKIKEILPSAKIIGGSSETQIEVKFKAMNYTISVYVGDIPELRQYSFEKDHLRIGANITLTDLEAVSKEAIKHYGPASGQPFAAILKQLHYFAGRQIRNVGTPAGNLVTASPISDLNPVFVATNSVLTASTTNGDSLLPMSKFFTGYRQTALPADGILSSIQIPIAKPANEFIRSYKQAKRKDDDIAIVTGALRVSLNENKIVENVNLVYGGMAAVTKSASKTEEYLVGKEWGAPATLEGAFNALDKDFTLSFGVPGGMAQYRKSLALGFFYRFWNEVQAELNGEVDADVIPEIEREISAGERDQKSSVAYEQKILGKDVPHVAAMKQVTGEAIYTDDIPHMQGELYGRLVLSAKAHAKLLNVDASAALEMPGVKAFISHKDFHDPKANYWGAPVCDELFFAVDEVFTHGQPIGLILADTNAQAEAAVRAVRVEYEELPAILTMEEAIEKNSMFSHLHSIVNGKPVEEALKEAENVLEGVSRMGGQEHFYLETNAVVIVPKGEDGEVEVYSCTQNPTETQAYVAQVMNVQANKVVTKVKRLGGGFGGKETRSIQIAGICALASKVTGKPVRCMLNRDEDMMTSGQRHPFLSRWKVGFQNNGKITALDADVFCNGGWTQDLSAAVVDRSLSHVDGCYKIPNINVRGRICKTNTVSNTAFRGFGGPQGLFIAECYIEQIADKLGIPADEVRQINMYKPGETTHFNQELQDWYVPLMYNQVKQEADYEARRKAVDEFNATHKWKKRGLALIPTKFGISFTALFLNQAGALVHIYHDGSVLVAHGGTEMGQGLHTKMAMIAAEALKVPLEDVHITETATNTVANTSSTAASASSDLNGYAIWNACQQLNERLQPYREKFGPDANMHKLATAAYFDRVNLSANGFYKTPEIGYVWGENKGKMFFYFTQGVALSEVEIDCLTGDHTAIRTDLKMDVGRSINPAVDYGQIEGAFVQGQGLFTIEESLWQRNTGQLFTRGPGAYKIPGFRDIPQTFNVSLLKDVEWKNLRTIQRSRGVGEPPLFLGSSVFFAIRDALKAARKEFGETEPLQLFAPATAERIRVSCADPIIKRSVPTRRAGEDSWWVYI